MYRSDFFKTVLSVVMFILLLVGCESRDKTEGGEEDMHTHPEHLGAIDEHTLGHVLHAMGVSAAGEERLKIGQAVKVMYFVGDNGGLREVGSSADANMTVYLYGDAYVAETRIDVSGGKEDSHIFVGVSSDIKRIIDMNLHGVKNNLARDFVKTFKGLDITDGRVDLSIGENDGDAGNILSTVNFIIGSLAKTVSLVK
ncbi:hypothetical protein LKV13_01820 [Borrelia sp. BU AG58]|uniref:hypothetical protein n=1 Tax=Borrelia sp. BU AG58 TaxID=2887345 RepID=UPI001E617513|nr:hypothetical protein [Borrelia sp. BU AG58]UER67544.1 hypothetical protein LKV13_01820 [Borrelia sp. BU AG58]